MTQKDKGSIEAIFKKELSPTVGPLIKKLELIIKIVSSQIYQLDFDASTISLSPSPKWIKYMNK